MAGLGAARSLQDQGVRSVVVEGAARLGGRLHTEDVAGHSVDLGAAWIHGPIDNPLSPLATLAGVVGYPTTFSDVPEGLFAKRLAGPLHDSAQFASGVREFWTQAGLAAQTPVLSGTNRPDRSFRDLLDDGTISPVAIPANSAKAAGFDFAGWVGLQGHEAADLEDLSFDGYDYDTRDGGDILLADGGYLKLVEYLSSDHDDIRLETKVLAISSQPHGFDVLVRQTDFADETIAAAAVIVTTSIGVLQAGSIKFDPPLSSSVLNAIDGIGMGANEKLVVSFADWPWEQGLDYAVLTDSAGDDPFVSWLLRSDAPIAVSYAGGRRARAMGEQSDAEALDAGLKALTDLFGPLPQVLGSARTTWVDNPLIKGSYSFNTSVRSGDARELLSKPVLPGLVLSGEAMNVSDYGTAHGALIAGRRSADQVVAHLRHPGADGNKLEDQRIDTEQR